MKTYVHFLLYISLMSSYDEKCFKQICRKNQNTHFVFNIFLFPKIVLFMR